MTRLFIYFLALLFGVVTAPVQAGVLQSKTIVASSNNIPTAYDVADAGSHMAFTAALVRKAKKLCCLNQTSSAALVFTENGAATTSPVAGSSDWTFFANSARCMPFQYLRTALTVQWASDTGGAIAAGKVRCEIHDSF